MTPVKAKKAEILKSILKEYHDMIEYYEAREQAAIKQVERFKEQKAVIVDMLEGLEG